MMTKYLIARKNKQGHRLFGLDTLFEFCYFSQPVLPVIRQKSRSNTIHISLLPALEHHSYYSFTEPKDCT